MARMAELHAELVEDGFFADPTREEMEPMDVTGSQIDAYLDYLDEEAARDDARWIETLAAIGNLAYCVTRYDLTTGKLYPTTMEAVQ